MLIWCPDTGTIEPPGEQTQIFTCQNFFPTNRHGYAKCGGGATTSYTTAAANVVLGSAMLIDSSGTPRLFVGSQKKIQEANGSGGWTDRSNATTYSATDIWCFAAFGDDMIATSKNDPMQVSSGAASFSDLAGSPPKAKFVIVQSNVVLAFNINDGTDRPDWWASSDQNDPRTWTAASTNYADKDRLYGGIGGAITAAATWQEQAIVFKKSAMYRGRFTGDTDQPWVWDFISTKFGCPAPFGHIETEAGLVFVTERDFMLYDGSPPVSIADAVRKTLMADIGTHGSTVFCTVDEPNNCVYFWYLESDSTVSGSPHEADNIAIWNYKTGKWGSQDSFGGNLVLPTSGVRGVNYTNFTSSAIAGGTNGGKIANLVFGGEGKLYNMTGGGVFAGSQDSITSALVFWEQGDSARDMELARIRTVFNLTSGIPSAATAQSQAYPQSFGTPTVNNATMTADKVFDFHARGRYFSNTITISGTNYGEILRILPEYIQSGRR